MSRQQGGMTMRCEAESSAALVVYSSPSLVGADGCIEASIAVAPAAGKDLTLRCPLTSALRGRTISALLGNFGRRATGAGGGDGFPSSGRIADVGRRIPRIISSYTEGCLGKIGAISSISPQFHTDFSQVEVVGRQQNLGAMLGRRHWHTCLFLLQPQQS
jgi:hypothetical protein